LSSKGRFIDGAARKMRCRDIREYYDCFLPVRLGQAGENGSGGFLRLIEFADPRIGRDAVGIKPVLVQEARPYAVLVRVGNAECILGSPP